MHMYTLLQMYVLTYVQYVLIIPKVVIRSMFCSLMVLTVWKPMLDNREPLEEKRIIRKP